MLKSLDQIMEPDTRNLHAFGLSLEHFHLSMDKLALAPPVPDSVQASWDRARHLWVYAWFVYDFFILAEFQAIATLELALRERLGPQAPNGKAWGGLQLLLKEAEGQGLLPVNATAGPMPLTTLLRHIRNNHGHGTADVHTPAMTLPILECCHELIETLFPGPGPNP
jgi:hypothetical protein